MFTIILPAEGPRGMYRDNAPDDEAGLLVWLRTRLGGQLRRIGLSSGREMWVNPDGIGQDLPMNRAATAIVGFSQEGADPVYGDAIVMASNGPDSQGLNRDQALITYGELHAPWLFFADLIN